jgi:myosin-crossreactive antigen
LPESFLNYQDNFELKVEFAFLQSFCGVWVRKEFPTKEFLEQKSISNYKSAKLKKCIAKVFQELKDLKVIESEFQILTKKNRLEEVTILTSGLVSRSKLIFYRENLNNKFNY